MLTEKEMVQIEWAIKAMNGYKISGIDYVSANNVIGLIERYSDRVHKDSNKEDKSGN